VRPALVSAVLLVLFTTAGCGGSKKKAEPGCPPPPSTASAGAAQISARAVGKGYAKLVVIRATEKADGAPVHEGKVSIRAEMSCPHFMPMYTKRLKETSTGTYKAGYSLVMPGRWTFYITVRDKNGDATTSALPVTVKLGG
jgi:YtkA-like